MIRQITIPPFANLEPYLQKPAQVDREIRDTVSRILTDVSVKIGRAHV